MDVVTVNVFKTKTGPIVLVNLDGVEPVVINLHVHQLASMRKVFA